MKLFVICEMKRGIKIAGIGVLLLATGVTGWFLVAQGERSNPITCINNLRQIEAAKWSFAMENGRTTGWHWANNEQAFAELVNVGTGYMKCFPLCPASTTDTQNAAQSAADYEMGPMGRAVRCKVLLGKHKLEGMDNYDIEEEMKVRRSINIMLNNNLSHKRRPQK